MECPKGASSLPEPPTRRTLESQAPEGGGKAPSYEPSVVRNLLERLGASQFCKRPEQLFMGPTAACTSTRNI